VLQLSKCCLPHCKCGLGQKYPQYSLKENEPNNKINAFNVLIIVMILVYGPFDVSWQELGRPIFLEGVFGLTQIKNAENIQFVNSEIRERR